MTRISESLSPQTESTPKKEVDGMVQVLQNDNMIMNIISLLMAFGSIIIAYRTFSSQKKHNELSTKPIIDILVGDYENDT